MKPNTRLAIDAVVSLEVVEHVANLGQFLASLTTTVNLGGLLVPGQKAEPSVRHLEFQDLEFVAKLMIRLSTLSVTDFGTTYFLGSHSADLT